MNDYKATHCFYCEKPFGKCGNGFRLKTKDHIIPKSAGGKNILINYVYCCQKCNEMKSNRLPEIFAADLRYLQETAYPKNRKTLSTMLTNVERLILEIGPYRHELVRKVAKTEKAPEMAPKQPT